MSESQPSKQSSTRRRIITMFALVMAGEAIFCLPFLVVRVFRPTLLDVFEITNLELGTAFAFYGVVAMVAYLPGGPIADRFSARGMMTIALLVSALGGIYYATMPGIGGLKVLFAFWGLTTILLFWAAMIRATREWGGDEDQGKAFGILDGGRGLLAAVLASGTVAVFAALLPDDAATATLAQKTAALKQVIWIFTGMTLAAGAVVWFCVPVESGPRRSGGDNALSWSKIRTVFINPAVWLQGMIVVTAYVAFKGMDNLGLFARDVYGFDDVQAANVSTIALWVRPIAALGAGFIADKVGGPRSIAACFVLMILGNGFVAMGYLEPTAPSQRVSHRNYPGPDVRFNGLGFRPVRTLASDKDGDGVNSFADCDDTDPDLSVTCGGNGAVDKGETSDAGNLTAGGGCGDVQHAQGIHFLHICGGTFDMGCTAGQSNCNADEVPAHTVTLTNDFWMSAAEVTQGQWQALMGNNPSGFGSCGADCPVERVNLWEVASFANALSTAEGLAPCYTLNGCTGKAGADLSCSGVTVTSLSGSVYDCEGYRLPTEAEWEYAARAGTDLIYAGSDTVSDVAWYKDNSGSKTHPSATLSPNAWGLYDMSGNVWEWAWDWYDGSYYSTSPSSDPEGPATSPNSKRVRRGGVWSDPAVPWMLFTMVIAVAVAVFGIRGIYFAIFDEAGVPAAMTGTAVGLVSVVGYTPDIFMGPLNGYLTDTYPGSLGHQYFFGTIAGFAVLGLFCTLLFQRLSARRSA